MRKIGLALLLLIVPQAHAGCEDGLLEKLTRDFGDLTNSRIHIACKAWPHDPSKTVIVLAHKAPGSESSQSVTDDEGVYDLDVMVQATESGEILLRETEKGALTSDAIALQDIAIDGASYPLAKGVSGFGVRTRRSNRHAEIESLSLYAVRDGKVVRVLAPLHTALDFWESDNDMQISRSSKTRGTLALTDSLSHGWNDLVFTVRNTEQVFATEGKPDVPKTVRSVRKYRLRYDGQAYVVPKSLVPQQY